MMLANQVMKTSARFELLIMKATHLFENDLPLDDVDDGPPGDDVDVDENQPDSKADGSHGDIDADYVDDGDDPPSDVDDDSNGDGRKNVEESPVRPPLELSVVVWPAEHFSILNKICLYNYIKKVSTYHFAVTGMYCTVDIRNNVYFVVLLDDLYSIMCQCSVCTYVKYVPVCYNIYLLLNVFLKQFAALITSNFK
jgi:hypothetical protein